MYLIPGKIRYDESEYVLGKVVRFGYVSQIHSPSRVKVPSLNRNLYSLIHIAGVDPNIMPAVHTAAALSFKFEGASTHILKRTQLRMQYLKFTISSAIRS